jgi:competence protein ComEC
MKHLLTDKFFLKLSLALLIGIISCEFLPIYLGLVIPIVIFFSIYLIQYFFKIQNRSWRSIALFSTLIFFGFGLHYYNFYFIKEKSEKQLYQIINKETTYLVRIEEKPEIRETSIKLKVTLLGVYANQKKYSFSQKMILYLDPTIQVDSMNYGDLYRVYGAINYPTPPLNPNEFDYKKWLTRNHIFATGYSNQIEYLIFLKNVLKNM